MFSFHNLLFFAPYTAAVVGLSRTGYTMSSTAEEVQVCVRVWRPTIDYPFNIFFNFTDETAGEL